MPVISWTAMRKVFYFSVIRIDVNPIDGFLSSMLPVLHIDKYAANR